MERRQFIKQSLLGTSGCLITPRLIGHAWSIGNSWERVIASKVESSNMVYPSGKRVPLGWKTFPVSTGATQGKGTVIYFPKIPRTTNPVLLRLSAAIDIREEVVIDLYLAQSGTILGSLDIRYAHPFQPFQFMIDPIQLEEIYKQGIALKQVKGANTAWFYQPDKKQKGNQGLQPHLLVGKSNDLEKAFRQNLLSMNSIAPFGWIGGCVHDALWEMGRNGDKEAMKLLKIQLNSFLDDEKGISFENPMTQPRDGSFNSIEDFLPFAPIAGLYPDHPSVQLALDYMMGREGSNGLMSGNSVTTEGCYTLAYPLAVIASRRNDKNLAKKALIQLTGRAKFLHDGDAIYQHSTLDGKKSFRNWGRGIVWYLLGIIKTYGVIKEHFNEMPELAEVAEEFVGAVSKVDRWRSSEGLWYSFIDRPETGIDTSASAGIALAMAWGYKYGLIDPKYRSQAAKTYKVMVRYLTPDGFLTQVSQINRGGEALQASGYRVITQFGMGLFAQLSWMVSSYFD